MAKLLIVDDLQEIHQMLDLLLGTNGLEMEHAFDGEEGIRKFKESPADVVLTDIRMPLCDGIEMIQELLLVDPDVVTIVMTGYESPTNLKRAIKVHAFEFLSKPYSAKRAITVLELALQERQNRRLKSLHPPTNDETDALNELTESMRAQIKHYQERERLLDLREVNIHEKEQMIRDRQRFLANSEASIEKKMHDMLVKEAELEQMMENINAMSQRSA